MNTIAQAFVTVREAAVLLEIHERTVRKLIQAGKLPAETDCDDPRRAYKIPRAALNQSVLKRCAPPKAQNEEQPPETAPNPAPPPFTEAQRAEIAQWKDILAAWRLAVKSGREAAFLQSLPERGVFAAQRTLYNKLRALQNFGEAGLIDHRRGPAQAGHIPKIAWDIFKSLYLDETRKSVELCRLLTEEKLKEMVRSGELSELPELPSVRAFRRHAEQIPIPETTLFREGETAFIGKCAPYIQREYESLKPNEFWICDNHTADVMVNWDGKALRPHVTLFIDARTRKPMGWEVTRNPCADATLAALKMAVERFGAPENIYGDNGREFLFRDFAQGFRRKAKDRQDQPTILAGLGTEYKAALPRNARAKPVERTFLTVKNGFSKLFQSFTGGSVLEKPETLEALAKNPENLSSVQEFETNLTLWIEGVYNQKPQKGAGMEGKSPDALYAELMQNTGKRELSQEQLNLLFLRWSPPLKVGKNGVTLNIGGKKLQYFDQTLWHKHFGQQVHLRYDPEDLKEARVYDKAGRFLCTAPLREPLSYKATKEEIAARQRQDRAAVKAVKAAREYQEKDAQENLRLMMNRAQENLAQAALASGGNFAPGWIEPIFQNDGPPAYDSQDPVSPAEYAAALEKLKEWRTQEDPILN